MADLGNKDEVMERKILRAAEELFLEKGFAMTSTTEIARRAGCNQALVHYYFRTKERLFEKIYTDKIELFASGILNAAQTEGPFLEKIARMVGTHFDILSQNPKLPFLLINELTTNLKRREEVKKKMEDTVPRVLNALSEEFAREIAKGTIRPITLTDFFLNVLSLNAMTFLMKPIVAEFAEIDEVDLERALGERKQEIISTILHSLRP